MEIAVGIALLVGLAVITVFVGIQYLAKEDDSLEKRLQDEFKALSVEESKEPAREKRVPSPVAQRLNQTIATQQFATEVAIQLARANLSLTVSEYFLIQASTTCVGVLAGLLLSQNVLAAAILGALGFFGPGWYLAYRQRRRLKAFQDQLSDVLTLLVGSLRAGYSLLHALDMVVKEAPPPASEELGRVVREVGLGLSLSTALNNLTRRVESGDLDLIVTAINIQQEVGGNLATILETISDTIRQRVRIQGEIRVITTSQKTTGYVLSALPFGVGTLIFIINPSYMMRLFKPGWTLAIPITALIMMVCGFLVISKIVDIEV